MRSKKNPDQPTFIQTARRSMIIACAITTLAEFGYENTSLAQIAKRAGIAKSAVSYYFDGKDALMWAVLVEVYSHVGHFMQAKMQAYPTIREMLRAYIEANLMYVRAHPDYMQALIEIIYNKTGKLSEDEPTEDTTLQPLEALLKQGQQTGEFRAFDPRPMAVTIRRSIDGALAEWTARQAMDMEAYARELVTIFDLATHHTRDSP